MAKGEISWKRRTEEGEKVQVYADRVGNQWNFYWRYKRFDSWEPLEDPPLEDWLELLDGIERRLNRRRVRPEEVVRCKKLIRERYPDAKI